MDAFNRAARQVRYRLCEKLSTGNDGEGGWRKVEAEVQGRGGGGGTANQDQVGLNLGGEEPPASGKMFINHPRQATNATE